MVFSIFFSNIPNEGPQKENYILKSLLGNFQDGGLRARSCQTTLPSGPESASDIWFFPFPQPGIEDRSLTSNSLDCCFCVKKFDPSPPHVSYRWKIYLPKGAFLKISPPPKQIGPSKEVTPWSCLAHSCQVRVWVRDVESLLIFITFLSNCEKPGLD